MVLINYTNNLLWSHFHTKSNNRLIKRPKARPFLAHQNIKNIALSIFLQQRNNLRAGVVDISFRARYGGEPTVGLLQFAAKAAELKKQLDRIM